MNDQETVIGALSSLYRAEYRSLAASSMLRCASHDTSIDLCLLERHFEDTTEHILRLGDLFHYLGYPFRAEIDLLGALVMETTGKKEVFSIVSFFPDYDGASTFLYLQRCLLKEYRMCLDMAWSFDRPKVKVMLALSLAEKLELEQRLARGLRVNVDASQAARGFDVGAHLPSISMAA